MTVNLKTLTSKKCAYAVFTRKYSRSSDCNGSNVMAAVNCANLKTEILSKIIEIQFLINKIEITKFIRKQIEKV